MLEFYQSDNYAYGYNPTAHKMTTVTVRPFYWREYMGTKVWYKSRTMATGVIVTLAGIITVALQLIGVMDISQLPPDVAEWVPLVGSALGLIMMFLRSKTSQALAGTKAALRAATALDITEQAHYKAGLLKGSSK